MDPERGTHERNHPGIVLQWNRDASLRHPEKGRCIVCGAPSEGMVIFAKAY